MGIIIEKVEAYDRALTVEEVAELSHVSSKTLYRHVRAGKLKAYHIGSQIRLDPKITADWLRSRLK